MKPLLKRVAAPADYIWDCVETVFGGVQADTILGFISANRQLTNELWGRNIR